MPHRSPLRLAVATVVAVASGVAALAPVPAAADGAAIHPSNRPTPLAGAENGYVPPERLITVVAGCDVAREAAPSLALLYRTAAREKVAIGARDCYRPVSEQVAVSSQWTSRGNSACAATPERHPDGRPKGTSMHGWGKAVDVSDNGRGMTFSSAGYAWLKRHAGTFGWNHPGWAEPGGSACPEAWHWEWVGDGGTMGLPPIRADVVGLLPAADGQGHAVVTGLGDVQPAGSFADRGGAESLPLRWVVVGGTPTATGGGYWLLGADGGVFSFGDARFHGSTGNMRLNSAVLQMASTADGGGYWLVAGDGGIFSFGSARFFGSTGAMRLNSPVVGMAATPDGNGYWLVAADGGIFAFGTARFFGSTGAMRLNSPVVGMAATPDGNGYWLLAADGGIFSFGTATFHGSAAGSLPAPAVALTRTTDGTGYWITAADGTVAPKGTAGTFTTH